ncbi:extracellular solute-binding protein [[Clostridium] polysaccharolyticum]|uniref:ABC-type glycerol-3-phosphate transport system, substrate-binding protein n=1 Tax=[Clostridium] polysaccharolyticum TaxID=29364 RepID=A0A1H9Z977_9FIRM|nr:extracellular solute-binding protein [[Clostridium] polysaccharolyticum]SES77882.1 ABC-type glycerol-3-phosphate transport system, substrate-binding protein [[Clostridium] polysaccharolyticum]
MKKKKYMLFLLVFFVLAGCQNRKSDNVVRVALPYSETIQNPDKNYYIKWLSKETGLTIKPVIIHQKRCREYLDALFASEVEADAVLLGENFTLEKKDLQTYIERNVLEKLSNGMYYYPDCGNYRELHCGQTMWINTGWLHALSLSVPRTTKEFKAVLKAFRDKDPNGNGRKDEIPLIGSLDGYEYNPVEFILNSYIVNDPFRSRFYVKGKREEYAPFKKEYREGIAYLNQLYSEKLLDKRCFTYSRRQLQEIVNSQEDLVGIFTAGSVADILYQGNPEIMARYIHVLPLKGPEGEQHAITRKVNDMVGAIVPKHAKNKKGAIKFLEKMISTEGSLIARFGEEGVDWEYSDGHEVSLFGEPSAIVTKNYLSNIPQNKHLNGIGPMDVPIKYLRGVTWNGVNSDTEYIDARAEMGYEAFLSKTVSKKEYNEALCNFVDDFTYDLVKGRYDVWDNGKWNTFLKRARHWLGEKNDT